MSQHESLDRYSVYRPARNLTYSFGLLVRRKVHWFLAGIAALALLFPHFPILYLVLAFIIYALSEGPYYDPVYGPHKTPVPGGTYKDTFTKIEGPPDKGGKGDWFVGNDMDTSEEIWHTDDGARTHIEVFGTTGGGKTVMLLGWAYQAIIAGSGSTTGSGLIMVDGKADPATWMHLYNMAKVCGRTNDLLVLNFITNPAQELEFSLDYYLDRDPHAYESFKAIESNTFNLFAAGNSDTLSELFSSLLGESGGGDQSFWRGRAEAMMRAILKVGVFLRNKGEINLSVAQLRKFMLLEEIVKLEKRDDIPELERQMISRYLDDLPGFRDIAQDLEEIDDPAERAQLMEQPAKQHGFLTMQFTELLGLLESTYGHIFNVEHGDIDFRDIMFNRRILYVMLPALEKSPESMANLGRLAVAGLKSALMQALSGRLSGWVKQIIEQRPTNSKRAMLGIFDEYGSYAVRGFAEVAAQARSLGLASIFSGQDYPSFQKQDKIEASRVHANTGLTIALKTECPETTELIQKRVGRETVLKASGKRIQGEMGSWQETGDGQYVDVDRIDINDLAHQAEGQGYVIWRRQMIHMNTFAVTAGPVTVPEAKRLQMNDLVPIPGGLATERRGMRKAAKQLGEKAFHREVTDQVTNAVGEQGEQAPSDQSSQSRASGEASSEKKPAVNRPKSLDTLLSILDRGEYPIRKDVPIIPFTPVPTLKADSPNGGLPEQESASQTEAPTPEASQAGHDENPSTDERTEQKAPEAEPETDRVDHLVEAAQEQRPDLKGEEPAENPFEGNPDEAPGHTPTGADQAAKQAVARANERVNAAFEGAEADAAPAEAATETTTPDTAPTAREGATEAVPDLPPGDNRLEALEADVLQRTNTLAQEIEDHLGDVGSLDRLHDTPTDEEIEDKGFNDESAYLLMEQIHSELDSPKPDGNARTARQALSDEWGVTQSAPPAPTAAEDDTQPAPTASAPEKTPDEAHNTAEAENAKPEASATAESATEDAADEGEPSPLLGGDEEEVVLDDPMAAIYGPDYAAGTEASNATADSDEETRQSETAQHEDHTVAQAPAQPEAKAEAEPEPNTSAETAAPSAPATPATEEDDEFEDDEADDDDEAGEEENLSLDDVLGSEEDHR